MYYCLYVDGRGYLYHDSKLKDYKFTFGNNVSKAKWHRTLRACFHWFGFVNLVCGSNIVYICIIDKSGKVVDKIDPQFYL